MTTNFESQPSESARPNAPMPTPEPSAMVPRATLNTLMISMLFLFVGVGIGFVIYDRIAQNTRTTIDTEALINSAVSTAIASLPTAAASTGDSANAGINARQTVRYEGSPSKGPADAPIVMIEFADFQCSYCKSFFDQTIDPLMEQFDGRILHVFRNYPLLGPVSVSAALAAACANDQGKFWEFHDLLYGAQNQLNRDAFIAHAETLELDVLTFTTCFDEQLRRPEVAQDYVDAQNLGVGGTPTFFINGKILIGAQPIDEFILQIEAELLRIDSNPEAVQATPASS